MIKQLKNTNDFIQKKKMTELYTVTNVVFN